MECDSAAEYIFQKQCINSGVVRSKWLVSDTEMQFMHAVPSLAVCVVWIATQRSVLSITLSHSRALSLQDKPILTYWAGLTYFPIWFTDVFCATNMYDFEWHDSKHALEPKTQINAPKPQQSRHNCLNIFKNLEHIRRFCLTMLWLERNQHGFRHTCMNHSSKYLSKTISGFWGMSHSECKRLDSVRVLVWDQNQVPANARELPYH